MKVKTWRGINTSPLLALDVVVLNYYMQHKQSAITTPSVRELYLIYLENVLTHKNFYDNCNIKFFNFLISHFSMFTNYNILDLTHCKSSGFYYVTLYIVLM